ncbi:MAG: M24 family metallopeptidase, partial [Halobacteriales archaeon]|nr:M24 family metallopeptidase [Halobacteriales archaeon]
TEAEVYADMARAQIANGGEAYLFNLFDSGDPMSPEYLHLLHGKPQPLSPTQRTLEEGDLVKTEFHASYGGYLVAADMSVVLGDAPPEVRRIHEVSRECSENARPLFEPGTRLEDLWEAFREPAREADMDFISLGFHGHGLSSPEFPTVTFPQKATRLYPEGLSWHLGSGRSQEDIRLEEGMVFGTNVDLYDPNWRNDVGLMSGETVLVTETGPEMLLEIPDELVV